MSGSVSKTCHVFLELTATSSLQIKMTEMPFWRTWIVSETTIESSRTLSWKIRKVTTRRKAKWALRKRTKRSSWLSLQMRFHLHWTRHLQWLRRKNRLLRRMRWLRQRRSNNQKPSLKKLRLNSLRLSRTSHSLLRLIHCHLWAQISHLLLPLDKVCFQVPILFQAYHLNTRIFSKNHSHSPQNLTTASSLQPRRTATTTWLKTIPSRTLSWTCLTLVSWTSRLSKIKKL